MHDLKGTEGYRSARIGTVLVLIGLGILILRPFLNALVWAGILSILCMPIQQWLLVRFPRQSQGLPILLIFALSVTLLGPVCWLLLELQDEASIAYQLISADFPAQSVSAIAIQLGHIPFVGAMLVDAFNSFPKEAHEVITIIKNLIPLLGRSFGRLLMKLSDQILQNFTTVVALYFFLRDGPRLVANLQGGLTRLLGIHVGSYFRIIRSTVYAVSFGIMGSALIQGLIATCGYVIFGLETPLLLGLLSVIASLVPVVGAFLVWGPLVLVLLFENDLGSAIGLTLWGLLIVHPADNVLRPWVIGKMLHSPLLLILLGVVGGILGFGLSGVFLGPCILSMLFHLWSVICRIPEPDPGSESLDGFD